LKLALFGAGAMGKLVMSLAQQRGHEIGQVFTSRDRNRTADEIAPSLHGHDAAIDFSLAEAVPRNIRACAAASIPIVEGTTGWTSFESEARQIITANDAAMIYGANFSVGVNLFYRLVSRAAELFQNREEYEAFIEEAHHSRKRDAPSGTALKLKALLGPSKADLTIASTRAGHIPGTHTVGFDSAADQITLQHTARSREGFALGALLAAEWIVGKKGVFEFTGVLDDILRS
jgi:4-hydroxy-tetrahydrodipicolinate reductase